MPMKFCDIPILETMAYISHPCVEERQTCVSQAAHKSLRIGIPKKKKEIPRGIFMRVSEYGSVPMAHPVIQSISRF